MIVGTRSDLFFFKLPYINIEFHKKNIQNFNFIEFSIKKQFLCKIYSHIKLTHTANYNGNKQNHSIKYNY